MLDTDERLRLLLREVNERIRLVNASFVVAEEDVELFCECGASECMQLLRIPASAHDRVRADDYLFIARPGHERLGERVEADDQEYLVVRCLAAPATGTVEALARSAEANLQSTCRSG